MGKKFQKAEEQKKVEEEKTAAVKSSKLKKLGKRLVVTGKNSPKSDEKTSMVEGDEADTSASKIIQEVMGETEKEPEMNKEAAEVESKTSNEKTDNSSNEKSAEKIENASTEKK